MSEGRKFELNAALWTRIRFEALIYNKLECIQDSGPAIRSRLVCVARHFFSNRLCLLMARQKFTIWYSIIIIYCIFVALQCWFSIGVARLNTMPCLINNNYHLLWNILHVLRYRIYWYYKVLEFPSTNFAMQKLRKNWRIINIEKEKKTKKSREILASY